MKIPLTIQVGSGSQVHGETTCVSKHGASIRVMTGEPLACGDSLQITLRSGRQAQSARVVWVDKVGTHLCAIELEQVTDFWGIRFPGAADQEWRPAAKPAPEARTDEVPATAVTTAAATQTPTPAVVVYPLSGSEPAAATPAREQDPASPTATITGISAIHSLLAEKVQVAFTAPGEGVVFLCNLVEPGTRLRLFLTKDQAVLARVVSIGDKREGGKWRVRVRFEVSN